jgi:signal transduction histidine kinase
VHRWTLLDDLGLVPALKWLVADITNRTPTRAELTVQGSIRRLPPEVEVALYPSPKKPCATSIATPNRPAST